MKPRGPAFAVGMVAVGVLAGLVVAFAARGEGIAAAAALVDPTRAVVADIVKPAQTTTTQGAAAPVVQTQQPTDTSRAERLQRTDAVAAAVVAKVEARGTDVHVGPVAIEHKSVAVPEKPAYVAPRRPASSPRMSTLLRRSFRSPRLPRPSAPRHEARREAGKEGDELESASAADALAQGAARSRLEPVSRAARGAEGTENRAAVSRCHATRLSSVRKAPTHVHHARPNPPLAEVIRPVARC